MNVESRRNHRELTYIVHEEHEMTGRSPIIEFHNLAVGYGDHRNEPVIEHVSLPIYRGKITAIIGHSGYGKSTLLRSMNRMNELVHGGAWTKGEVSFAFKSDSDSCVYRTDNIYDSRVDPVELRRKIGMVFQKPNVFPASIYDNVAYGPNILGIEKQDSIPHRALFRLLLKLGYTHQQLQPVTYEIVELALKQANLWDEVKNNLHAPADFLSGGQQQRVSIARVLATNPSLLLMDEPCSNLDPISTHAIEEMILDLHDTDSGGEYTTVIVTHNMEQAKRIADYVLVMGKSRMIDDSRAVGTVTEWGTKDEIFNNPQLESTENFIKGVF